jgi:hypothetical protein
LGAVTWGRRPAALIGLTMRQPLPHGVHAAPQRATSPPARRVACASAHAGDSRLDEDHTSAAAKPHPPRRRSHTPTARRRRSSRRAAPLGTHALPGPPHRPTAPSPHQRTAPPRGRGQSGHGPLPVRIERSFVVECSEQTRGAIISERCALVRNTFKQGADRPRRQAGGLYGGPSSPCSAARTTLCAEIGSQAARSNEHATARTAQPPSGE